MADIRDDHTEPTQLDAILAAHIHNLECYKKERGAYFTHVHARQVQELRFVSPAYCTHEAAFNARYSEYKDGVFVVFHPYSDGKSCPVCGERSPFDHE